MNNFYKGFICGALAYPLCNLLVNLSDGLSTLITSRINVSILKMNASVADLQEASEKSSAVAIGFQAPAAAEDDEEEYEE